MSRIRFVMLGGFLGAGKTTTIARLAAAYQQQGLKVGIVTNDQASDLVDTHTLRARGFDVGEVAGACFCCNFNELTETVDRLESNQHPDVILAEPVGSCTDLVATVVQPLRQLHKDQFSVAPYGVLVKPRHGTKILKKLPNSGFSPKAAYIFEKQLEEADFIVVNRIDQLAAEEVAELCEIVQEKYPGVPVVRTSAKTGENFSALVEMIDQEGDFGRRILDLDYDVYAEGEAELGWLNTSFEVEADEEFALDSLLVMIVDRLRLAMAGESAETAHLKAIGLSEGYHGVANLISSDAPAELSLPSDCSTRRADLIVNARVAIDPDSLQKHVLRVLEESASAMNAKIDVRQTQSFRPGRPVPTHRFASS